MSENDLETARSIAGIRPKRRFDVGSATSTPFVELDRKSWATLAASTPLPLTDADVTRLAGLGERIDLDEVSEVYLPLSRLLNLYVKGKEALHDATQTFLRPLGAENSGAGTPTPFVIGVAGSVAVGKSTTARILRELLARWPDTPRVELVTTDGFLFSNDELARRGISDRKGFPESYNRRALLRFVSAVKSGAPEVRAPVYSHLTYDIVPGAEVVVRQPDVLIVEGLNVLQPARPRVDGRQGLAVSDFFDFTVYVDAKTKYIRQWYIDRFLTLRSGAFANPDSYFHRYASLDDDAAITLAGDIWASINEPNLIENVLPTRGRASLVLTKAQHHRVKRMLLRKL